MLMAHRGLQTHPRLEGAAHPHFLLLILDGQLAPSNLWSGSVWKLHDYDEIDEAPTQDLILAPPHQSLHHALPLEPDVGS